MDEKATAFAKRYLRHNGYTTASARPAASFDSVDATLARLGMRSVAFDADMPGFRDFLAEVDYDTNFPAYVRHFGARQQGGLQRKYFEQYLAARVLEPKPEGRYMDVAAAGGPFVDILRQRYDVAESYAQDIRYPEGVHGFKIGSNASSIPMEAGSFDGIVLLNAFEHFEYPYDVEFLREASRLLRPGGVLAIIPYVLVDDGYSVTDPEKWVPRSELDTELPQFDKRLPVILEPCRQRLVKVPSTASFAEDAASVAGMSWELCVLENVEDFQFQKAFVVGRKS